MMMQSQARNSRAQSRIADTQTIFIKNNLLEEVKAKTRRKKMTLTSLLMMMKAFIL